MPGLTRYRGKKIKESTFEKRLGDYLKGLGVYNRHLTDQAYSGIPDRYAVGGNWIECKVKQLYSLKTKKIGLVSQVTELQKKTLLDLEKNGDRAWFAILILDGRTDAERRLMRWPDLYDKIIIGPYRVIRETEWTMDNIAKHSCPWKPEPVKEYLSYFFGPNYERFSNYGSLYPGRG